VSEPVMLHPRLEADTHAIGETAEYWLRWMNDRRFPWVIVVPKKPGLREWHELDYDAQHALLDMVNRCSLHLQNLTGAEKMNIGALGNLVPQLHIHIIARRSGDACWPGPVWGQGAPEPWGNEQPAWLPALRDRLSQRCA
jgi:diadenosine tetraphosphate (Ap4A) HIT family hydrolase